MKRLSTLAIIPARKGSKSIVGKNYKIFNKKPLIQWTIELVKSLKFIDYSVISSNSSEIEKIAKSQDFNYLKRPNSISTDSSQTEDCIFHVIKELRKKKKYFDIIFLFEPTSPLRKKKTVSKIYKFFIKSNLDSIYTVSAFDKFVGKIKNNCFLPISQERRRQDRKKLYCESGVVYIFKTQKFLKNKKIITKSSYPYKVDILESQDINTQLDFTITEFLHSKI